MNRAITPQEEFSAIYADILATKDTDKAYHLTRKLCHLSFAVLKTPPSYHQLVNVSAQHPHTAGIIFDRMSKMDGMEIHLASVAYKAAAYIEEMMMAGENGRPLTRGHLAGITGVSGFNFKSSLKALRGFRNLDVDVNEHMVVNAMMTIIAKHPEQKICGLGYVLGRGTLESLMVVSAALSTDKHDNATALTTKVFGALGAAKAAGVTDEKEICDAIKEVAVCQGTIDDGLTALSKRRSVDSYATLSHIITGVQADRKWAHPVTRRSEHALFAMTLIISDKGRGQGALEAVQQIASVSPSILDPVARVFFLEEGGAKAPTLIAKLGNDDGDTKEFLESEGGEAAITVWEAKVKSGKCAAGQALKGLLTLRFNMAGKGDTEQNMDVFNNAVIRMANHVCQQMTTRIQYRKEDGDIDAQMNELVFGKNTGEGDWVEELKSSFDRVAIEVGHKIPRDVLEKAVNVIEAQDHTAKLSAEMSGLTCHLARHYGLAT